MALLISDYFILRTGGILVGDTHDVVTSRFRQVAVIHRRF